MGGPIPLANLRAHGGDLHFQLEIVRSDLGGRRFMENEQGSIEPDENLMVLVGSHAEGKRAQFFATELTEAHPFGKRMCLASANARDWEKPTSDGLDPGFYAWVST